MTSLFFHLAVAVQPAVFCCQRILLSMYFDVVFFHSAVAVQPAAFYRQRVLLLQCFAISVLTRWFSFGHRHTTSCVLLSMRFAVSMFPKQFLFGRSLHTQLCFAVNVICSHCVLLSMRFAVIVVCCHYILLSMCFAVNVVCCHYVTIFCCHYILLSMCFAVPILQKPYNQALCCHWCVPFGHCHTTTSCQQGTLLSLCFSVKRFCCYCLIKAIGEQDWLLGLSAALEISVLQTNKSICICYSEIQIHKFIKQFPFDRSRRASLFAVTKSPIWP